MLSKRDAARVLHGLIVHLVCFLCRIVGVVILKIVIAFAVSAFIVHYGGVMIRFVDACFGLAILSQLKSIGVSGYIIRWVIFWAVLLFFMFDCFRGLVNKLCRGIIPVVRVHTKFAEERPLKEGEQDILGRDSIGKKISKLILEAPYGDGAKFVGLWGTWGVGKTSCLHLIEEQVKKTVKERDGWLRFATTPIFIRFNPLKYSGRFDLLSAMYEILASSKWMRFYGISGIASAVGRDLLFSKISGAPDGGGNVISAMRFVAHLFSSEERTHAVLVDALATLNRRVCIVIDDLDRLPSEEVCAIIRMLRSVGNLPNVTYLILANEDYIAAAVAEKVPHISKCGIEDGRLYLKKMIPDSVVLPEIANKYLLLNCLRKMLSDVVRLYWFKYSIMDDDRLVIVEDLLSNVRDVKRLYNATLTTLDGLKYKDGGVGVSVNITDLVVLEAVRLRWPEFYAMLPQFISSVSDCKEHKDLIVKLVESVPYADRQLAYRFLAEFVLVDENGKSEISNRDSYKLYEEYRLASFFCYENYFATSRPRKTVPRARLETAVDYIRGGDVANLTKLMLDVDALRCLSELLYFMQYKFKECSAETASTIFRALARVSDCALKSPSLASSCGNDARSVEGAIYSYARVLLLSPHNGKHLSLGDLILAEPEAISLFAALINEEDARHNKGSPSLISANKLLELVNLLSDRINQRFCSGGCVGIPGLDRAVINISHAVSEGSANNKGVAQFRARCSNRGIDIVVFPEQYGKRLKDTLFSVLTSLDRYEGVVKARLTIVSPRSAAKAEECVDELLQLWPEADMQVVDKVSGCGYSWVTFVREGDVVVGDWFCSLAFYTFCENVDFVSFDFYSSVSTDVKCYRARAVEHCNNADLFTQLALDFEPVAVCFWNKMYNSDFVMRLGCDFDNIRSRLTYAVRMINDIALRKSEYSHCGKVLIIHRLSTKDAEDIMPIKLAKVFCASRNLRQLQHSKWAAYAFRCLLKEITKGSAWHLIGNELLPKKHIVDDLVPSSMRVRRLWLRAISRFPRVAKWLYS